MSTKTKIFHYLVFLSIPVLIACISLGCNGKSSPSTPYDLPFSPTPTQIVHVYGPVMVSVVDKNLAVHGRDGFSHSPFRVGHLFRPNDNDGNSHLQPALPGGGELDIRSSATERISFCPLDDHHARFSRQ